MLTKDGLRAALIEIDAKIARAEEAAKPARAALEPFLTEIYDLADKRELLLEENEAEHLGKCFSCTRILFAGDLGCRCGEDGDNLCEECSPTLGEALMDWQSTREDDREDDYAQMVALLSLRSATEGADVKMVGPL